MLRVDLVSPPFAGHLFPILQIARQLQSDGLSVRVLTTRNAERWMVGESLPVSYILKGREEVIDQISDPGEKVGYHPLRLKQQFRQNLSLMKEMKSDLKSLWQSGPPELVIADFTVPIAGVLCEEQKIEWWTLTASPCALECPDGPPAYMGGMTPSDRPHKRLAHWLGRKSTRIFKKTVFQLYKNQLKDLGFATLYRGDGFESIYSPHRILAAGIEEIEFQRSWPKQLQFIGPLTEPSKSHSNLTININKNRKNVLVSLGTHLDWAKRELVTVIEEVAAQLPTIDFHFSFGGSAPHKETTLDNLRFHKFIPYHCNIEHFDLAIIHGGTGVMYSALQAGIKLIVCPFDYDQFDNAARLQYAGLAKVIRKIKTDKFVTEINDLLKGTSHRSNGALAEVFHQYGGERAVSQMIASNRKYDRSIKPFNKFPRSY